MGAIWERLANISIRDFVAFCIHVVLPSILFVLHAELVILVMVTAFHDTPITHTGAIANITLLVIVVVIYMSAHRQLKAEEMRAAAKRSRDLERGDVADSLFEPFRPSSSRQTNHPQMQQQVQRRPLPYQSYSNPSSGRVSHESRQSQARPHQPASSLFQAETFG